MKDILVVAVHPDDETLGCGGTLLKHKKNGDRIHWLICTESNPEAEFYKTREQEISKVSGMYGFKSVHNLQLQAMRVDEYSLSDLVGRVSRVINAVKPQVLYLPFYNDVHSDHRKVFEAVYSCTKSFRYEFIEKIYMMETLSETEFSVAIPGQTFVPNMFVDISKYIEEKINIMKVFESEISEHPFPRSIESIKALAQFRGSTMGCKYAESFTLLKEIVR